MGRLVRLGLMLAAVAVGALPSAHGPRGLPSPAAPAAAVASKPPPPPGSVEVRVTGVVAGGKEHSANAVLLTPTDPRIGLVLPVVVSGDDAAAVMTRLHHESSKASESAAQLGDAIRALGATLEGVELEDVAPLAARGRLKLKQDGRALELQARGSDSIALALEAGVPLFVPRALLGAARAPEDFEGLDAPAPQDSPAHGEGAGVHL